MVERSSQAASAIFAPIGMLLPELEALYKDIHAHPELSMQETRTAGLAADALRKAGYEVATGIGKTGVVALLRNGEGPTVMLRADMDALPIKESTGLAYASGVTAQGAQAMLDDGLLERFPAPDVVLGQHVMVGPAGTVAGSSGPITSAADSLQIRLFGRGAHGSMPQASIDPVISALAPHGRCLRCSGSWAEQIPRPTLRLKRRAN